MRPTWPPRASSMPAAAFATFFFQAEDGIRDTSVTGVQTCALPIFERYLHLHSVWTFFISRCFPICFLQALSSFDRICQLRPYFSDIHCQPHATRNLWNPDRRDPGCCNVELERSFELAFFDNGRGFLLASSSTVN